jgi:hypothetical protein
MSVFFHSAARSNYECAYRNSQWEGKERLSLYKLFQLPSYYAVFQAWRKHFHVYFVLHEMNS